MDDASTTELMGRLSSYLHKAWYLLWVLPLVFGDQITKYVAGGHLKLHHPMEITSFLNLTLVHNRGAAFGMLHNAGSWRLVLFVLLALTICVWLVHWLLNLHRKNLWERTSLLLIISGAVGNLIDRIFSGHVVDFIDVHLGAWHWPAFNLADSMITLGVIGLLISIVFTKNLETHH